MKFLDEAKIYLSSGNGGKGCVGFRREKYVEYGGPDGGNGGRGGHIYIECVDNLNTLIDYRYTQHFRAPRGDGGRGKNQSGRDGKDIVLRVPAGTVILDEDKETVLADMTKAGEKILLLKGGDGGFGNVHFKSSTNRAPRKALPGWPGEEKAVWLRLKLIADAGIIGMPNAGKSTFLAAVTRAKPKIADYPFTTLAPNLGVVRTRDREFVLADIPGLIEGAHEGHGLGTRFLGHVERTKVLLHLIDSTQEDVVKAYKTIRAELKAYGEGLAKKPEIIALNKADAMDKKEVVALQKKLAKATRKKVLLISAVSGAGVPEALDAVWARIEAGRAERTMADQRRYYALILLPFLLPAVAAGFFPQIDLAVSGWFYTPGKGFVFTPFLEAMHRWGPYAVLVAALAVTALLAHKKVLGRKQVLFVVLCFAIGPGLIVNGIFKEHYGRARPMQVEQFGGKAHFTSAFTPANECAHNCSFTSGDPTPTFTLIAFALLFPRRRAQLTALTLVTGLAFSLMRVAQGGHFFSDVLFTAVICMGTAMALFKTMFRNPARG